MTQQTAQDAANYPDKGGALAEALAASAEFKGTQTEVDFEGYKFMVNTDLLDDVEIVDLIERIEAGKSLKAIIEFLDYLIGHQEYIKMKDYFVAKEGRFKLTKLTALYQAIFAKFDPKG